MLCNDVQPTCCCFAHHVAPLQEFQSLTSDTDADAGEDDHIKALFHEIDSNKDGKVRLVALLYN